jgi:hypothetical protein
MTATRELEARRMRLLELSAIERDLATAEISTIVMGLARLDHGLERIRRWPPGVVAVVVVAGLLALGRLRGLRGPGTALGLLAAGLRIGALAGRLRGGRLASPDAVAGH